MIKIYTGIFRFIIMFAEVMFFFVLTRYISNRNNSIRKFKDKLNSKKYKYIIAVIIVVIGTALLTASSANRAATDFVFFALLGIVMSLLESNK